MISPSEVPQFAIFWPGKKWLSPQIGKQTLFISNQIGHYL